MSQELTEALKSYILDTGADLVGFGPVDRLEGAPEIQQPQRYLPDASIMISIALHINEAACDLIASNTRRNTVPPSYHSFQLYTLVMINRKLDEIAYQCAKFLEDRGYRAYPFPANLPHILKPSELYPGGPGDISHKHVAVACGVGHIGWHTMLVTPQYASRQKLVTVITNAPLKPDPMLEETTCDPDKCGAYCAQVCPTNAIPEDTSRKVGCVIGGHIVEYGKLVGWRCRWGCSGMLKCTGGYKDIPIPDTEPTAEELLKYKAMVDPWQKRVTNYVGAIPFCGRCLTVCCGSGTCNLK
ncbi:MAG: 4Fe-4S binding protein [Planctomycetota bacterium]|jgi:epoxyqueuosine reductase QueG